MIVAWSKLNNLVGACDQIMTNELPMPSQEPTSEIAGGYG